MDHRRIATVLAACVFAASAATLRAQQQGKVWRVGVLETTSRSSNAANVDALLKGLRELGYVEGQNLAIHYRSADGRPDRFQEMANALVAEKVDLIVTRGTPATRAVMSATSTIPIVMASAGSPVRSGLVKSLARPGGNVTGLSANTADLSGKRLELLKEIFPRISQVGLLANMSSMNNQTVSRETEKSAQALHIHIRLFDVRKSEDLQPAFEAARKSRVGAMIVASDTVTQANQKTISQLAVQNRLPTIGTNTEFVAAGGFLSYSANIPHLYYRAATYVDKVLKGAKPADLPMEEPSTLEFVINVKTAKALAVSIPAAVQFRADRLIE